MLILIIFLIISLIFNIISIILILKLKKAITNSDFTTLVKSFRDYYDFVETDNEKTLGDLYNDK